MRSPHYTPKTFGGENNGVAPTGVGVGGRSPPRPHGVGAYDFKHRTYQNLWTNNKVRVD